MLRDYRAHAFSQAVFGVLIDADVPLPAAALVVRPRRRGIYFGANNSPYMWRENKSSASDRFGPVHFRSTHARTRRHLRSGCICGCREANTWWTPPRVRIRKGSSLIAVISLQRQDFGATAREGRGRGSGRGVEEDAERRRQGRTASGSGGADKDFRFLD